MQLICLERSGVATRCAAQASTAYTAAFNLKISQSITHGYLCGRQKEMAEHLLGGELNAKKEDSMTAKTLCSGDA